MEKEQSKKVTLVIMVSYLKEPTTTKGTMTIHT